MITAEAQQLYEKAVAYSKRSGCSYAHALRTVLEENSFQHRNTPTGVLEASIKLDLEIGRLMSEKHVADYREGMQYVLESLDPRHIKLVRAYADA